MRLSQENYFKMHLKILLILDSFILVFISFIFLVREFDIIRIQFLSQISNFNLLIVFVIISSTIPLLLYAYYYGRK